MITAYSFAMSVIFFNISLVIVYLLRRKESFIARYGIQTLMVITVLGFLRLVLPVDFERSIVVRSYDVIPAIQDGLNYPVGNIGLTLGSVLIAIWVAGIIVYIVKDIFTILRFKRIRDRYTCCESAVISKVADELGIAHKVLITPCVSLPFVAGHFKQMIYVPPLDICEDDWKYVLMHEKQHIAAHDQLIKLLFLLLRSLFWWNPVSHLFIRELDAILELRCDAAVTGKLDDEGSHAYFVAMLSAIKKMLPTDKKNMVSSSALVGGASNTRSNIVQRFEVYRDSKKLSSKSVRNAIQVLLVLVFIASYFVIVQPAYSPPEEDIFGASHMEDNEVAFIIFNGEEYSLYVENEKVMEITSEQLTEYPYNTFPVYNGG